MEWAFFSRVIFAKISGPALFHLFVRDVYWRVRPRKFPVVYEVINTFGEDGMSEEILLPVELRPPPLIPQGRTLRSWREIAGYMNRGIRTVQRWEKLLDLPVHRLAAKAEVFAFSAEVDAWFQSFAKDSHEPGDNMAHDWREVAEQASHEEDPEKLLRLINELNHLLGENESQAHRNQQRHPTPGPSKADA